MPELPEQSNQGGGSQKILRFSRAAWGWIAAAVAGTALFLSKVDTIISFWRAHTTAGFLSQVSVGLEFSTTASEGVKDMSAYHSQHVQGGTIIKVLEKGEFYGLPALDFRIANNSPQTVIVTAVILDIAKSHPDNRPELRWESFLNIFDNDAPNLVFTNEGWGAATDLTLKGKLTVDPPEINPGGQEVEVPLGVVSESPLKFPLAPLLQKYFNFDLKDLRRVEHESSEGQPSPGKYFRVELSGKLSYNYLEYDKSRQSVALPFKLTVVNEEPGVGAALPPRYLYNQLLDVDRHDYTVRCPVSLSLASKEADRFVVTLSSKQSSIHDFNLSVVLGDGSIIRLGHFVLELYLPRSEATDQKLGTDLKASRERPED